MMKRESRYLVIKKRDITAAIDAGLISFSHAEELDVIAGVINDNRERQGKGRLQCVVVESDWPEYEAVWAMIEARIDGTSPAQPVAEVISKYGDPESFGEREIRVLADLQKIAYSTKLFCTPPPAPAVPADYQHLKNVSESYFGVEKRLFSLALRIKGPSFDYYAYSLHQAIDVLEKEIFGENEDSSAMLAAAPTPTNKQW